VYGNPDVMAVFMRIELEGLTVCTKAQPADPCAGEPFFPCEQCMVEERLGGPVDPRWPDDLAIAYALQVEAAFRDYEAVDRVNDILTADLDGRLLTAEERKSLSESEQWKRSAERRDQLLDSAEINDRTEMESAAYEVLLFRRARRILADQAPEAEEEKMRVEVSRGAGMSVLSEDVRSEAEALVEYRRRASAGEIPRDRRVSKTNRQRIPTFANPSFGKQLGRLRTEEDERKLRSLVRQLRHQAKQRGLLSREYDRRRAVRSSAGTARYVPPSQPHVPARTRASALGASSDPPARGEDGYPPLRTST
jgi:hypothetical protein